MQIFISKITTKEGSSTRGSWEKWLITDQNGKMYDSWIRADKPWNHTWKEGDTLEVDPSQLASREYNGTTYVTINPTNKKGAQSGETLSAIQTLHTSINTIISQNTKILSELTALKNQKKPVNEDEFFAPPTDAPNW